MNTHTSRAGLTGFDAPHIDIAKHAADATNGSNPVAKVHGNKPVQSVFYPTVGALAGARDLVFA